MNATRSLHPLRILMAFCLSGWLGVSVSHATIEIDSFAAEQYVEVFGAPIGPLSATDILGTGTVLGGERDILLSRTSNNGGGVVADVNLTLVNGIAYSSDIATTGDALVVYDGADGDAAINHTGLGGVDLTESGLNTRLEVGVTSDLGATVVITVYTDADSFSTASVLVPADPTYTFVVAQVPFSSFTSAGSDGGADFTNVGAITVKIDGSAHAATDVLVNYFVATGDIPPQEEPDVFCSLTQGAYGNCNGKFNGERRYDMVWRLLATDLVLGKTGRSLTIKQADTGLLIKRMPAGGTAAKNPAGNYSLAAFPAVKNGRFNNVLLGQTVALSLNTRLCAKLPAFILCSEFKTQAVLPGADGLYGTADDALDPGPDNVLGTADDPVQTFTIPVSVLNALANLGLPNTVVGLLELANRALGGWSTGGASLSAINSAADAINRGFDECRALVDCVVP